MNSSYQTTQHLPKYLSDGLLWLQGMVWSACMREKSWFAKYRPQQQCFNMIHGQHWHAFPSIQALPMRFSLQTICKEYLCKKLLENLKNHDIKQQQCIEKWILSMFMEIQCGMFPTKFTLVKYRLTFLISFHCTQCLITLDAITTQHVVFWSLQNDVPHGCPDKKGR